ncbi:hypothetical protein G4G27_22510 [Sphingomonas sp. So64.6b]|uniref:DUF5681 domain-containing protein n=1 Tax=Sphingomonas sp. So64.6b TaxID=2997354 RepID=UPI0016042DFC|nr:DUF5681 domain-containing protein [Sphingomonas sp. So64.6b]QNA86442.1 hypothetical protein G4G27_22510 [Sphingomonas sp. So64.6b]
MRGGDGGNGGGGAATESAAARGYAVGHGKPPLAHRFGKGNRANPGGKKKVRPCGEVVPRLPAESVHEMLMAEAMRMVRVKAGGRFVEIPAMQAAFREIAMKAARGNRLATATLARLVMQSEAAHGAVAEAAQGAAAEAARGGVAEAPVATLPRAPSWDTPQGPAGAPAGLQEPGSGGPGFDWAGPEEPASAQSKFVAAVEYKAVWTRILTEAATLDAEIAAPSPHPDDVAIGRVRGIASWPGKTERWVLDLDSLAQLYAGLQKEWPARRPGIEAMPDGYEKAVAWCEWFAVDDARALIARHLPQRYAGKIEPDVRSPAERLRDQNLRIMAAYDRERHERQRASEAASKARNAAREAGEVPGDGDHGGSGGGNDGCGNDGCGNDGCGGNEGRPDAGGDGNDRAKRAAPVVKPLVGRLGNGPPRTVLEAAIYCQAWRELLRTAGKTGLKLKPMPPPEDVLINGEDDKIDYRVPLEPDKRATLVSLRGTLAKIRRVAAAFNAEVARTTDPDDAGVARRQRDVWLSLAAIIERRVEGVRAGFG